MNERIRSYSSKELKALAISLMGSFSEVRQKNETIIRGEILSFHSPLLRGLRRAIRAKRGSCYMEEVDGKKFLIVAFPGDKSGGRKWVTNLVLFLATILSTLVVGAILEGVNPLTDVHGITAGIPFSVTIIGILGLHELGHYFAARRYGLDVSLPYFIPFPTVLGTLGAFIKMRSPIHNRRMLLEIGAAGPIAGFLASIPAVVYGLSLSTFQDTPLEGTGGISLGSSILFSAIEKIVVGTPPAGQDLFLHPVAFAGWAGFFVTALNLLPIGQLDGGHVSYALFGSMQKKISKVVFAALVPLGFLWPGWLIWVVLILLLIKIPHPPVVFEEVPVGRWRMIVGWVVIATFILTFIPAPVAV